MAWSRGDEGEDAEAGAFVAAELALMWRQSMKPK
jgi:hypothetical protein